ncbi:MBL fold metallo-hydrolase [Pseudomonas azotoformans]|uniref:MBL fold metallo-hydrolase n=1 Tax=Pseudomonas azotoformans TaxID=47878 RepID=UPI00098F3BFD|nr:MBL fold metallo-hydrolase [Pseudomonas azotoformans]AQT96519.1 hypothetical protein B1R45_25805 [Pseudomonas azotoformans]UMY48642.1 MBL fold metallo-hydrolase [Pseudomonas azotoformans]
MDTLVALPVSGDSFLLRRDNYNILVDAGYSSRMLIAALSKPRLAISHLHIVVCTHADKDHAGGLTDLLDKSSISVGEFWLPGAWSESLPELLKNPDLVVNALIAEFDNFSPQDNPTLNQDHRSESHARKSIVEESHEAQRKSEHEHEGPEQQDVDEFESHMHALIASERRKFERDSRSNDDQLSPEQQVGNAGLAWLKKQTESLELNELNDADSAKAFGRGRKLLRQQARKNHMDQNWTAFGLELIDTAERIRKIAVQAIRHSVKVRWFDFGEFAKTKQASGGEPDLLVPLNAVEVVVPPPPTEMMMYMLRLTPVNEECLVFLSPGPTWRHRGVVFTGDSPLGHGSGYRLSLLDWPTERAQWVVATAPHHGSESNAVAYEHLEAMTNVELWLRSGGSSKHPGPTFRRLPQVQRGCTHCPRLGLKRGIAEVQLSDQFKGPSFRVKPHDCSC